MSCKTLIKFLTFGDLRKGQKGQRSQKGKLQAIDGMHPFKKGLDCGMSLETQRLSNVHRKGLNFSGRVSKRD